MYPSILSLCQVVFKRLQGVRRGPQRTKSLKWRQTRSRERPCRRMTWTRTQQRRTPRGRGLQQQSGRERLQQRRPPPQRRSRPCCRSRRRWCWNALQTRIQSLRPPTHWVRATALLYLFIVLFSLQFPLSLSW